MVHSIDRAEQQPFSPAILLVEDEPGIVDFVRRGLQAEGFAVEAELDGIEGERRALHDSFDLIVYLLRHHGRVLSREQILSAVWGYEHDPTTNIVDVYIGYLRRKLNLPDNPAPIFTVRSVGYRLGNAA